MNDAVLARIRKLLAVAEHPTTPAGEADAATRAAERLIAKYAVDEALLDAAAPTGSKPEVRTIVIDAPYSSAKTVLVGAIANAHGVRAVTLGGGDKTRVSLIGFASDLQIVDLLYTSLLLQATTGLRRQAVSGRAFRRAFLIGFASEVSDRLQAARIEAVSETNAVSTALVLRSREQEVDAALRAQFPRLRHSRVRVSDGQGLNAGRSTGASANLTTSRNEVARPRPAAID
jgi:Protein of unknown function (DUF2786)